MNGPEIEASRCFEPVSRADARVLILGTLPGRMSLERNEYYAQPRNSFWPIMSRLTGGSNDLPYRDRLRLLTEKRIALWDVCAEAARVGSMDHKIQSKTLKPNDFGAFFELHPHIELICFNGSKAESVYRTKIAPTLAARHCAILSKTLPSTSPAHASLTFAQKLSRWEAVLQVFRALFPPRSRAGEARGIRLVPSRDPPTPARRHSGGRQTPAPRSASCPRLTRQSARDPTTSRKRGLSQRRRR